MSNQTLRERFEVEEKRYTAISTIIKNTVEAGLIKDLDPEGKSKKYAQYIPSWA